MSRVIAERRICLPPKFLDSNIPQHISEILKKDLQGKCDQEYGYILKVYDNIHILDNTVSNTGAGVYYHVKFGLKVLKPKIGETYTGTVCMIFPNGIFVEVQDKMKVLIPVNKMGDYKYNKSKNVFATDRQTISTGCTVEMRIDLIKYERQNFNCIGTFLNKKD